LQLLIYLYEYIISPKKKTKIGGKIIKAIKQKEKEIRAFVQKYNNTNIKVFASINENQENPIYVRTNKQK